MTHHLTGVPQPKAINTFGIDCGVAPTVTQLGLAAQAIADAWQTNVVNAVMAAACASIEVEVTDLNTATGAQVHATPAAPSPGAGNAASPGTCAVVQELTATRGARTRGRLFISPLVEAAVAFGFVSPGTITALNAGLNAVNTALKALAAPMPMSVISRKGAGSALITNFATDVVVGSQRRRVRRVSK